MSFRDRIGLRYLITVMVQAIQIYLIGLFQNALIAVSMPYGIGMMTEMGFKYIPNQRWLKNQMKI